ncbi:phage tail fiber protein [Paenibacillus sp. LjRoot56]|uniref:phage tail fiber protein n=1 Tax=Paenibacillus sp. LjRoot56 TaxID=3342333 RepID=UPI003ECE28BC
MATGYAISNYLENAILNHFLRGGSAVSQPSAIYLGLFTDAAGIVADQPTTEVSGGSYARTAVTCSASTTGTTANTGDVTFPTASASWGTINYVGVFDASTSGNLLFWGALTASKTVASGDTFKITTGSFTVTLD